MSGKRKVQAIDDPLTSKEWEFYESVKGTPEWEAFCRMDAEIKRRVRAEIHAEGKPCLGDRFKLSCWKPNGKK
jgi:hypothetical protein